MGSCLMVLSRRLVSRAFSFSFLKLKKKINSIRAKVTFGFSSGDSGNFLDLFGRLFKSIASLWFREQIPRRHPSSGGFLRKVTCSFYLLSTWSEPGPEPDARKFTISWNPGLYQGPLKLLANICSDFPECPSFKYLAPLSMDMPWFGLRKWSQWLGAVSAMNECLPLW